MVTKFDIFEYMYKAGSPLKPRDIANEFNHVDYNFIYNILLSMNRLKLIIKNEYGFQVVRNRKNEILHNLILFCIKNDINYNQIINKKLATFISRAFLKKKFSVKDFQLDSRKIAFYVEILSKSGFALVHSKKPLIATIPYNSFLRDLVGYFGENILVVKLKLNIEEIEKELNIFRKLRAVNEVKYQRIIEEYEMKFIHHSLSLEGNPMTLPDTIKLLKDKVLSGKYTIESVNEVNNYNTALAAMSKDVQLLRPISIETILNYHKLSMAHRPEIAGKIRLQNVVIKGNPDYKICKVEEIHKSLLELMIRYNEFIIKRNSLEKILEFAAYFHNEFQHIHPFLDGNSRTTRLITFYLFRTQNIPVLDIPLGLLEEYVFSTKGAKKRDDKRLLNTFEQIIQFNLKMLNERLKN